MVHRSAAAVGCLLALVGCADRYLAPGSEGGDDAARYAEGSAEAILILRAANDLTLVELDEDVPLLRTAAVNIVAARSGADGIDGNADDAPFTALAELDAVPNVGNATLEALLAYAQDRWGGEVLGYEEGGPEALTILDVANTASHFTLEQRAGLGELVACNVFEDRVGADGVAGTGDDVPYQSLAELADVDFVDAEVFDLLLAYGESLVPVDCPQGFIVSSDGVTRFTTLSSALIGSPAGTVLDVCAGTFSGSNTVSKDVTLRGRGVDATTLTGVLVVAAETSLTIEGMTLRSTASSSATAGGIIHSAHDDSTVTVRDAWLTGGKAVLGGAIYSLGTLDVSDTTFADNRANIRSQGEITYGGAIYADGALDLERVSFIGNQSFSEWGVSSYGGAIYLRDASVMDWDAVSFVENSSMNGGALYSSNGSVNLVHGEFLRNGGAAIALVSPGTMSFESTDFGSGEDDNPGGDVSYAGAVMYYGNNVDLVCEGGLCASP